MYSKDKSKGLCDILTLVGSEAPGYLSSVFAVLRLLTLIRKVLLSLSCVILASPKDFQTWLSSNRFDVSICSIITLEILFDNKVTLFLLPPSFLNSSTFKPCFANRPLILNNKGSEVSAFTKLLSFTNRSLSVLMDTTL